MTTVHGYTNNQAVHDQFNKKKRRGRAAALNIIPTTTGATEAVCDVIPGLSGKFTGLAMRVPVPVGSIVDFVAVLDKKVTEKEVNDAFKKYAKGKMKGILDYTEDEIVSSDMVGNEHSSVVDGLSTMVQSGNMVKVLSWYDNEFGYSNRVVDVINLLKKWI
jgi:glyceraldehyde 3-phosphate dehydrogenase